MRGMRVLALACFLTALAGAQSPPNEEGHKLAGMTVTFSVDLPLDVPGAVIQPGTYVLRLKREPGKTGGLAELQLWDASETRLLADFHAVQSYNPASTDTSIVTYYNGTSGWRVLKAWNLLTTHYTQRVVYSPKQAAELAKITTENVL